MNWLKKQAQEKGKKKFLNHLSFAEVENLVQEQAGRLYPYVKDETRVALYARNSVETVLFFLALQGLQKEVFMINIRLTEDEIRRKLTDLKIGVVFSEDRTFISFQDVLNQPLEKQDERRGGYAPEQIAVIMDTSATHGLAKSVPLRWRNLEAHVQASQQVLGVREEDNWLLVLPLYHIGGLAIVLRSLYNGTAVTLTSGFDEEETLKLIEEEKVNLLSLVPTMLNRILDRIGGHSLRAVLVSGEFIPEALVEASLRKGIPIYKSYGMTETASQATTFCVSEHLMRLKSVGYPLPGIKVHIHNPDNEGVGEIILRGPMVMDGYLGGEPVQEFLHTQDIGYLDEEGYLFILDRRDNIIISGGENIYPREIENILYAHPAVSECAIVAMKDKKWGQVPALCIVSALEDEEIRNYLSARIARYKHPKKIIHLRELPKNSTGKLLKKALGEMVNED
ncbi:MAG TPA: o-succinylbenzoate--CoA ligase [Desulfitobacterium dehalogenans]|uniref:2-succinylbenzoate--CoA ligase n=1 Tax=Desulfitobacterium dehalogenans TaxID=36854 RepID=A0A7C6Z416_9FIRM|nr:o-succinylbenzoate--CoA ligase [Desulfitobacterium dehalogenans]